MKSIAKIYLLFAVSATIYSCSSHEKDYDEDTKTGKPIVEEITQVKTIVVKPQTFNRELMATGKLNAAKKSNVRFMIDGVIKAINIIEGQQVQLGQRLAVLDQTQAKSAYAQSKLRYKQAVLDYEDQLLRLGYRMADTSKVDFQTKNTAKLRSGLSNATIELKRSETELQYTILLAPFSGKIANLKARPFTNSSTFEYFCILVDDSELFAEFQLMEQELNYIKSGASLVVRSFSDGSESYSGRIVSINPIVDKTGMISVRAVIKNRDAKLLDGMSVKISARKSLPNQLIVPKNAVLERQGRKVIFTVNSTKAQWNYVEVAYENSNEYAVLSGLKAGDEVIYEGNINLAHNKSIRVSNKIDIEGK